MAKNVAGNPNSQLGRTDTGRTYNQSVKIPDVGGATPAKPDPSAPFVNPNPGSRILNDAWENGSCDE